MLSDKVRERISALEPHVAGAEIIRFEDLLQAEPKVSAAALVHHPKADDLASLIFTSGTTGRPKGVMLSHRNFASLLSKLAGVFDIDKHDGLLSVLPLHHTFEFTAGLLMPLMRGAQITYLDEIDADALTDAFDEGNITGMVGVPALWQLLAAQDRQDRRPTAGRGPSASSICSIEGNRKLRDQMPPALDGLTLLNWGKLLFWPVHQKFGGRLRLLISGGSALPTETMKALRGLGFNLFEGYGLTEASPVLTVNRPGTRLLPGTVGEPLPGIDVRIDNPDGRGVGEVVASGPERHARLLRERRGDRGGHRQDGWLHTGDLGRFDDDGRLYIVGRKKEMILGVERRERLSRRARGALSRLAIRRRSCRSSGCRRKAAPARRSRCMVVPDYEQSGEELKREEVRERLAEHVKSVSAKLPLYKRVKVAAPHRSRAAEDGDAQGQAQAGRRRAAEARAAQEDAPRRRARRRRARRRLDPRRSSPTVAQQAARQGATAQARMEELGFDSLMYTELGVALEAGGRRGARAATPI